ncbi:MAG: ABC transporter permease [Limnochordaceae bacterium]|nr:ABC transporter permease [Limnochordaceae bacterium]
MGVVTADERVRRIERASGRWVRLLRGAFEIARKDLTEFVRDRMRLVSFIIMPIFMMVMTGYIFPSQTMLQNVPFVVVDQDRGMAGAQLVQALAGLGPRGRPAQPGEARALRILTESTPEAAARAIQSGRARGALVIPPDLTEHLMTRTPSTLTLMPDPANPQMSALVAGIIQGVVTAASERLSGGPARLLQLKGLDQATDINYFSFMAPGIMAMVVVMAVMTGLAGAVSREREIGTLDGLLIAPVPRLSLILGKAISQSVRGLAQGALVLLLGIVLFGVQVKGSLWMVALMLLLGVFSFVGVGILVSAISTEQETALTVMMTLTFPMMFLSGAFFPVDQMPPVLQVISRFIPLSYVIDSLRKIMLLGAGWGAVGGEVAILAAFGAVTLAVAVPAFSRAITR